MLDAERSFWGGTFHWTDVLLNSQVEISDVRTGIAMRGFPESWSSFLLFLLNSLRDKIH